MVWKFSTPANSCVHRFCEYSFYRDALYLLPVINSVVTYVSRSWLTLHGTARSIERGKWSWYTIISTVTRLIGHNQMVVIHNNNSHTLDRARLKFRVTHSVDHDQMNVNHNIFYSHMLGITLPNQGHGDNHKCSRWVTNYLHKHVIF